MSYDLIYKWGFYCDKDDIPNKWFIRAEALDTDWYAMAYYSLDDSESWRFYETNNEELLSTLTDRLKTDLYEQCMIEKNTYLKYKEELKNMTVSNFM